MEQPQVEILVHIGAPSRAADDTWYRSLASSYIDFQPTNYVDPFNQTDSDVSNNLSRPSLGCRETEQDAALVISISSQSTSPFGSFKSPQASFRSVIDNADSPRIPARHTPEAELAENEDTSEQVMQSSWQTPSSVVQDSYQIGNAINASILTSPTRVLESYLQHFDSPIVPATTPRQNRNGNPSHISQNITRPQTIKDKLVASLVPATPAVVPCTPRYNPSNILKRRFEEARLEGYTRDQRHIPQQDEVSSDNIIEETIIMESSNPSSATRADSEPPPAKHHKAADTSPRALLRAASDVGPRSASKQRPPLTVTFLSDHGYTYDSLEIHAPEPPVSVVDLDPESFITAGLEKLAQDLEIPKRYKPKEEARSLRPLERGYWYLDCSTWESQLKRDTWAYLANYIGTGVAGWGIRCSRDVDFRWLRVYCWGSIAAHIYLLLYLATQRKIRYVGSSWIDGEGIPVIIMEAKS